MVEMVMKSLTVSAAAAETSVWKEAWNALFSDGTQYEYLGNGAGSMTSWKLIILGLFIGLALAAFGMVFNKRVLGGFVRKLLHCEALTPENAQTLSELGYAKKFFVRYGVRRGVTLRRVVRCREEELYAEEMRQAREAYESRRQEDSSLPKWKETPFRVNPNEHHFYIPEELKYTADLKFDAKGTTWLGAWVFVGILLILLVVVFLTFPRLLELLDDWVGAVQKAVNPGKNMVA